MVQQVNGQMLQEEGGGDIRNFDFQFMTAGDPEIEKLEKAELMQNNLTPEEIEKLKELMPYIFDYYRLMHKMETGEYPPEPTDEVMNEMAGFDLKKGSTNGQRMTEPSQGDGRVPQDMQNQREVPPRPVEGQMPENAPEMMAGGGKVDISGILEGDKPDWLVRALDPSTPTTKDGETIRSLHTFHDGNWIVFPSIRMVDGKLKQLGEEVPRGYSNPRGLIFDKAFNETLNKKDYIVIPARDDKEAEAYSRAISDEIGKRRGMQMGGVAAGPVGVVNEQGADGSGVADDVPAESDGFVVNAAAVRKIGLRKINDMIQKAIKYAEEQGIQLDFGKTPVNAEEILVSNGEVVIPDVLARIIGYDELEKINALGDKETDEIIEEEEQSEEPMKEMPVSLKKGGSSWQTYLDEYQEGPFPAEDAQIKQTILDTMEPYEDSELEDLELYKRNYEKYWNPETALKKRGPKRRYIKKDDTKIRGPEWDEYLNEAVTYEVSDDVKEAIRRVLPAFKFELEKHDMYDAKQFDYWSKIESRSGEDKISGDKNDYGTFQVNMPLLKKIFESDKHFKNFIKYYGPKATATTGMSPYFLRKLYLEDEESFKDLMVNDHATNLAVGLAGSLLPAVD